MEKTVKGGSVLKCVYVERKKKRFDAFQLLCNEVKLCSRPRITSRQLAQFTFLFNTQFVTLSLQENILAF